MKNGFTHRADVAWTPASAVAVTLSGIPVTLRIFAKTTGSVRLIVTVTLAGVLVAGSGICTLTDTPPLSIASPITLLLVAMYVAAVVAVSDVALGFVLNSIAPAK